MQISMIDFVAKSELASYASQSTRDTLRSDPVDPGPSVPVAQ